MIQLHMHGYLVMDRKIKGIELGLGVGKQVHIKYLILVDLPPFIVSCDNWIVPS